MEFISQTSASAASDAIIAVFLVLLTVVAVGFLITYLCRFAARDDDAKIKPWIFVIVFGVGFALRLVFAMCVRGYRDDYSLFTRAIELLKRNGLSGYYEGDSSVVIYPVVYVVYLVFGGLCNVTGLADYELGMQFMIKLPIIIAELLTAFAVYKTASRYFNKYVAITLCAFVCVCPIFFMGTLWSTPLVFTAMFACFAFYFMARKNHAAAIALFTAAAFSSREGIYLFPVACVFAVYHLVRAIINLKNAPHGKKSILAEENRAVLTVPLGFVGSVVVAYLIGLFMTASYNASFFGYIYEFLIAPFVDWSYFTMNGLSVYNIFNQSGTMPSARFPSWVFACVFMAIIIAVVCVVYFTKRNRATLVMLAAYSLFTMLVYYPGSYAIGFACALLPLVSAYALVRDKRLLTVLFVAGLAYVINIVTLLSGYGYLNNLSEFNFGSEQLVAEGAAKVVSIICAVLTVLAHLYFTYVAVGVGMTGQKKALGTAIGFGASMKEYFSNAKKD